MFRGLRIEGAQALPEAELRALWPHSVGATATVADIFEFARAVSEAYRRAGYALSFALVEEQTIEDGVFTIRVVEGFVEQVAVQGEATGRLQARIRRMAERIMDSRPLRIAQLERYLLLINDLPGVEASAVLSPGQTEGGALLTLDVAHEPVGVSLGYNSFLPESLGRHLVEASVEGRSVATSADLLRLAVQASVTSQGYRSLAGEFSTGLGDEGLRVGVSAFHSRTDPDDPLLNLLEYYGDTVHARLFAEYPILRSRERSLYVGADIAISNAGSDLLGTRFFNDRLRPLSLWAAFQFVDATRAATSLKATITRGLDILDARGDSRAGADVDYTILDVDAQRNQPIGRVFGGLAFVALAAGGQIDLGSADLFSGAECSYGGRRFGRAFDAGIISGEHCLQGSVELHWARQAGLPVLGGISTFDLYAFADGGIAREHGPLQPGERRRSSAASVGVGLNVQLGEHLSGLVEVSRQVALSDAEIETSPRVAGAILLRF